MLIVLDMRCLTVSLAMPLAHALLVLMGVALYGCPISMRVAQRGEVSRELLKRAVSSASVDDAMALRNMLLIVLIAPLCGGMVVWDGVIMGSHDLELRKRCHRRGFWHGSQRGRMHYCGCVDTCLWRFSG
jgi:hypothetical protein